MECKFLKHGVSISNNGVVKPCCTFNYTPEYEEKFHINNNYLPSKNGYSKNNVLSDLILIHLC